MSMNEDRIARINANVTKLSADVVDLDRRLVELTNTMGALVAEMRLLRARPDDEGVRDDRD